jgi:hypothetical protein
VSEFLEGAGGNTVSATKSEESQQLSKKKGQLAAAA